MRYLKKYNLFLEENNSQEYLSNLTKKKPDSKTEQKPTDEVDTILQSTEDQKKKIIAKKDTIEKGLLNNIKNLEPGNQKDVKTQVREYGQQVKEFDKTVKQIDNLKKTLDKSNKNVKQQSQMQKARLQNKL